MTITVSQALRSASTPASAADLRRVPSKRNGVVTIPTASAPSSRAMLRDDRSSPRARAPALAGGDEHHVRAAQRALDLVVRLLGRRAPDVRVGARAEALRQLAADVDLHRRVAHLELLDVRVHGDELDARDPGIDHPVDRVQAGAADADDADDRQVGGGVGPRRRHSRGGCSGSGSTRRAAGRSSSTAAGASRPTGSGSRRGTLDSRGSVPSAAGGSSGSGCCGSGSGSRLRSGLDLRRLCLGLALGGLRRAEELRERPLTHACALACH